MDFGVELELAQSHMAQKPVLRREVGCACVAREVSVDFGVYISACMKNVRSFSSSSIASIEAPLGCCSVAASSQLRFSTDLPTSLSLAQERAELCS